MGIHPRFVGSCRSEELTHAIRELEILLGEPKVVVLDFTIQGRTDIMMQKQWQTLKICLPLAVKFHLPVVPTVGISRRKGVCISAERS